MPKDVHPQIQAVLDKGAQLGLQSLKTLGVEAGRAQAEAVAKAGRAANPGPQMHRVENTTTGPGFGHVPVRIYRPNEGENAPAIVYFHGGGHVICSIETHDLIARNLALLTGAVVISVDYRMGPEHPFPAAVNDSYDAARWVAKHAGDLGIDTSKIAVCGDSAGANLATVTSLIARDSGAFSIAAQVLIYPVIDYRGGTPSYDLYGIGYGALGTETMEWFLERYLPDPALRDDWRACPRNAKLSADLPPALVITAECDVLHDDGLGYFEQLKSANVRAQYEEFQGMTHGFFGLLGQVDAAQKAHESVASFLGQNWDA